LCLVWTCVDENINLPLWHCHLVSANDYRRHEDSPRIWTSTNPWKISAGFTCISSTREDYVAAIDRLKASAPSETKATAKMNKQELGHLALIKLLEERIEKIDIEIAV
jgi:hypothetical protein